MFSLSLLLVLLSSCRSGPIKRQMIHTFALSSLCMLGLTPLWAVEDCRRQIFMGARERMSHHQEQLLREEGALADIVSPEVVSLDTAEGFYTPRDGTWCGADNILCSS